MRTCLKCSSVFPSVMVISGQKRVLSSRRYCLDCSPFGKNNRERLHAPKAVNKICILCETNTQKGRRLCITCISRVRRFRLKTAAVLLLGGKCSRCGWSGHIAGFDFHHKKNKEFTIGQATNRAWQKVRKEILKCELLCSICHRVEHSGDRGEKFLNVANEYRIGGEDS